MQQPPSCYSSDAIFDKSHKTLLKRKKTHLLKFINEINLGRCASAALVGQGTKALVPRRMGALDEMSASAAQVMGSCGFSWPQSQFLQFHIPNIDLTGAVHFVWS